MHGCSLTFDPGKLSDWERQKGTIKWSNTLFADQKAWSRSQTLQQATYKWLPLGVVDWISRNDWRLVQPSQMWVTDYSTQVSRWIMQNLGVTRKMRVSWKICSSPLPLSFPHHHPSPSRFLIHQGLCIKSPTAHAGRVLANTRPHQLRWGDWEMGTACIRLQD